MKNLLIWGATGQSIVLNDFLSEQGYLLVALYDRNPEIESPFSDVKLFNEEQSLYKYLEQFDDINYVVAIGGGNGKDRLLLHDKLKSKGYTPIQCLHPNAIVSKSAVIGEGCQILMGTAVAAKVVLGKSVIINTSASVDHECTIEDGCHIAPGVHLAGNITVGKNTFIGVGASICPNLKIGENVTIGAGSVVISDIPDNVVVYGVPAKVQKHTSING